MGYKRAVLTMAAEDSARGENLSEAKLDILQKYAEYLVNYPPPSSRLRWGLSALTGLLFCCATPVFW